MPVVEFVHHDDTMYPCFSMSVDEEPLPEHHTVNADDHPAEEAWAYTLQHHHKDDGSERLFYLSDTH